MADRKPGAYHFAKHNRYTYLKSANSERGSINKELHETLHKGTKSWGIEIIRTKLKEIDPPTDVQETTNKVVKAENEKITAIDSATAAEKVADGVKRSKIKEAEEYKQAQILHEEGEAEAIKLVNEWRISTLLVMFKC